MNSNGSNKEKTIGNISNIIKINDSRILLPLNISNEQNSSTKSFNLEEEDIA